MTSGSSNAFTIAAGATCCASTSQFKTQNPAAELADAIKSRRLIVFLTTNPDKPLFFLGLHFPQHVDDHPMSIPFRDVQVIDPVGSDEIHAPGVFEGVEQRHVL